MTTYAEDIAAIRQGREAREEAEEVLYQQKLQLHDLLQEIKKTDNKEMLINDEQEKNLEKIRRGNQILKRTGNLLKIN